jgi:protein-S-isoprenylcysteine O-methyltransferase Ste14
MRFSFDESAVRAMGLLAPAAAAAALWLIRPRTTRETAGVSLAFLWTLAPLYRLTSAAWHWGWWDFGYSAAPRFGGMPLELFLGWAFLWGPLAALALSRCSLPLATAIAFTFDLLTMPLCAPLVRLGPNWLIGEAAALLIIFVPAQLLMRWTIDDCRLVARTALQVVLFSGLILIMVPAIAGAPLQLSPAMQFPAILGLLALSAVQEFAERGGGTPFPLDPPKHLVTSGIYRYIRNPMQTAVSIGFIAAAAIAGNAWLVIAGLLMTIFSLGFAQWSEEADHDARFGEAWRRYRRIVPAWLPRWRPHAEPPATLYVAESCGACSPLAAWLRRRNPIGLTVVAAEHHPSRDLTRLTYEPADGAPPEVGVRAMARALEHLHLGWAITGALARLPVVREFVQLLADATGGGPRLIRRTTSA